MRDRGELWAAVAALACVALVLALFMNVHTEGESEPATALPEPIEGPDTSDADRNPDESEGPSPSYYWGIDTASVMDESFYACVQENFGEPVYAGRYLETKQGVSYGLTPEEVAFLHNQGIRIIPIYNHFTDATTYDAGVTEAREAISYAEQIGVKEGTYIFADIEPNYPVDQHFLQGWSETIAASAYRPGIYGVFVEASDSEVLASYMSFSEAYPELAEQTAVWTSDVSVGITTKAEAPAFEPEARNMLEVSIWQYGIDAEACNIDTNLMKAEMMDYLW
ncbi:glycoside hydrolase domain-containing protein [Xylanibacillus composti]|uniref:Rv2525c-like glycoside hydrolase-like domain-containing protein n=1 Tax=Xylanibacillus composti TaxID=1572762 RepID=A0A8J4H7J3_9BACL|nr:glycoside hydrolase domain-containing protein [Xylanibacillus composti]GIQ70268.1 hypothetical protein XYCOK13_30920 [Xylanibacillus composti]